MTLRGGFARTEPEWGQ